MKQITKFKKAIKKMGVKKILGLAVLLIGLGVAVVIIGQRTGFFAEAGYKVCDNVKHNQDDCYARYGRNPDGSKKESESAAGGSTTTTSGGGSQNNDGKCDEGQKYMPCKPGGNKCVDENVLEENACPNLSGPRKKGNYDKEECDKCKANCDNSPSCYTGHACWNKCGYDKPKDEDIWWETGKEIIEVTSVKHPGQTFKVRKEYDEDNNNVLSVKEWNECVLQGDCSED